MSVGGRFRIALYHMLACRPCSVCTAIACIALQGNVLSHYRPYRQVLEGRSTLRFCLMLLTIAIDKRTRLLSAYRQLPP